MRNETLTVADPPRVLHNNVLGQMLSATFNALFMRFQMSLILVYYCCNDVCGEVVPDTVDTGK